MRERVVADFEAGLPQGTKVKDFSGETLYQIVRDDTGRVLRADSRGQASGLIFPLTFDPAEWPWLEWRWRVEHPAAKGDSRLRSGDDFPARVYVIFPHWIPTKTRTINYIWANRLPAGEAQPNAYTGNAMMLALQSGEENCGQWMMERRNVVDDYRRLFGEEPPQKAVIAVMTDSDQTGEWLVAWYDDLKISR